METSGTFVLEQRWVNETEDLSNVLGGIGIGRIVQVGADIDQRRVFIASIPESAMNGSPMQAIVPVQKGVIDISTVELPETGNDIALVEADLAFERSVKMLRRIVQSVLDELSREGRTTLLLASTGTKHMHWMMRSTGMSQVLINKRTADAVRFLGVGLLAAKNNTLYVTVDHDFRGQWTPVQLQNDEERDKRLSGVQFLSRVHGSRIAVTTTRETIALDILTHGSQPIGTILASKRGRKGVVQRYFGRLGGDGQHVATVGVDPKRPREPIVTLCPIAHDSIRDITNALTDKGAQTAQVETHERALAM